MADASTAVAADSNVAVVGDGQVVEALKFEDELHRLTHESLEAKINKRNSLIARSNAAHGDRVSITEDVTENSDDPKIVKAREARDKALEALAQLVTPLVDEIVAKGAEGTEGLEAEIAEIDAKLKPGLKYYKENYGEDAAKHLPAQTRAKGMTVGRAGTGQKRIRGWKTEVTVDGKTTGFDNFSGAAAYLDVETPRLQAAFFEAAGSDDLKKITKDEVNFDVTFTETDEDNNESEVTATIRAYREAKPEGE